MPLPPEACVERRKRAVAGNYGAFLPHGYHGERWSPADLALLGTLPDAEVAARLKRSVDAVRLMRTRRGIPTFRDRRRG